MTPRRPSSAQKDTGPQRLPFAAAEALLWGPEMKKQHQWLLQQMRQLSTQHEAYDARIQTTEAVAEAAEAATARIRQMEQQIAAMEAVDKENTFENWAAAEMNQLKAFRDDNKNVRQKQIELDKEVASLADDVDKVRQVPDHLANLMRRVDFLGSRQKEDADRIRSLERDVASLTSGRQTLTPLPPMTRPIPRQRSNDHRAMTPPCRALLPGADENSETEDEDSFIRPRSVAQPLVGKVRIPTSPRTERPLDEIIGSCSTKLPSFQSARQRLFKRPSIHNSKLPRLLEEIQRQEDAVHPGPPTRAKVTAPATRLLDKSSPQKHNQIIHDAVIPRKTRAQLRNPEIITEQPRNNMKASEQSTQLVTRRPANPRKRVVDTGSSSTINPDTSEQLIQLVATSPRKKPRVTVPSSPKRKAYIASQLDADIPMQQKQLIVVLYTQSRNTQMKNSDSDDMQLSAAEIVKTSPRKAAFKARSCDPCSRRHVACDKAQPACGPCVKRSRGHACVYQPSHEALTESGKPTTASPRKKVVEDSRLAGSSGLGKSAIIAQGVPSISVSPRKRDVQSNAIAGPSGMNKGAMTARKAPVSIGPATPEEPSTSLRPREAKTRATAAISSTTIRPRRRVLPDTRDLDFDTFLKLKRENPKF